MKPAFSEMESNLMSLRSPARASLAAALFACGLGGCTTVSDSFTSSKIDYRSAAATPAPTLQVPPDLTQLGNDPRYQPPAGGAISANAMQTLMLNKLWGTDIEPWRLVPL